MGYGAGEYSRYTVTADSVDTVHRRGSLDYKDLSFQGVPEVQKHIYYHNPSLYQDLPCSSSQLCCVLVTFS